MVDCNVISLEERRKRRDLIAEQNRGQSRSLYALLPAVPSTTSVSMMILSSLDRRHVRWLSPRTSQDVSSPPLGGPGSVHLAVCPLLTANMLRCWLATGDANQRAKGKGRPLSGGISIGESSLAFIGEPPKLEARVHLERCRPGRLNTVTTNGQRNNTYSVMVHIRIGFTLSGEAGKAGC